MFCQQVFGNISGGFRDIARILGEFRGSATAQNIRSPVIGMMMRMKSAKKM